MSQVEAYKISCKKCSYAEYFEEEPQAWTCKICEAKRTRKNPDGSETLQFVKTKTCSNGHKTLVRSHDEQCEECVKAGVAKRITLYYNTANNSKLLQGKKQFEQINNQLQSTLFDRQIERLEQKDAAEKALIRIANHLDKIGAQKQ